MEKIRCLNCMEEITGSVCPYCGYKEGDTEQTDYGLKRNSILHGKYLIGNVLGQGGFGITYIGFDLALEIKVAIKEYFPMGYVSRDYTHSNQIVWSTMRDGQEQWKKGNENFLKEARRMAKIDVLPEIVRVRDTFMENNTSYIVMDYVEGETLKSWLLKNGIMGFTDCVNMLLPLMQSLGAVHKRGLIHRDISPDNIMVTPEGKVRLLDLGAAKDLSIESNGTSQLVTKKGFSPSEQYMENGNIGTWTDVYALCATIYYCITGKMVPESMERVMGATLKFDVPLKEALSVEALKTMHKGLAINAADRIQTVEELGQRLQKAIQPEAEKEKETVPKPAFESVKKEETVQEWKQEAAQRNQENLRKKKKIIVGLVIILIAILALLLFLWLKSSSVEEDDTETSSNRRRNTHKSYKETETTIESTPAPAQSETPKSEGTMTLEEWTKSADSIEFIEALNGEMDDITCFFEVYGDLICLVFMSDDQIEVVGDAEEEMSEFFEEYATFFEGIRDELIDITGNEYTILGVEFKNADGTIIGSRYY